jgi:hypothetical protein
MTRRITVLFLVTLLGCGCGSESSDNEAEGAGHKGGTSDDPLSLFAGDAPELPAVFAANGLAFGIDLDDAKKAGFKSGMGGVRKPLNGYPDVQIGCADGPNARALVFIVKLRPEGILPHLTSTWGEPTQIIESRDSMKSKEWLWVNSDSRIRARLRSWWGATATSSEVVYEPYMPLTELLGTDPKMFGFEAPPLMGMTGDEVRKAYPANLVRNKEWSHGVGPSVLHMPATQYQAKAVPVWMYYTDGKVTMVSVRLDVTLQPDAREATLSAIKTKYGEPESEADGKIVFASEGFTVTVDTVSIPEAVMMNIDMPTE